MEIKIDQTQTIGQHETMVRLSLYVDGERTITRQGYSYRHPEDGWDTKIGFDLAYGRALEQIAKALIFETLKRTDPVVGQFSVMFGASAASFLEGLENARNIITTHIPTQRRPQVVMGSGHGHAHVAVESAQIVRLVYDRLHGMRAYASDGSLIGSIRVYE